MIGTYINSYDLIVFPRVDTEGDYLSSGIIAAAAHCLSSSYTSRPIAGIILLNNSFLVEISHLFIVSTIISGKFCP